MSKPDLTLIQSNELPVSEANNFWKSCPLYKLSLPEKLCPEGLETNPQTNASKCEWGIHSEKHFNCFWRYVHSNSSVDGIMDELSLSEISRLMGWSTAKTNDYFKEALEELRVALEDLDLENE